MNINVINLSISLENVYEFLFVDYNPLGYVIILVIFLIIIWGIRSISSNKVKSLENVNDNQGVFVNEATVMNSGISGKATTFVSDGIEVNHNLVDDKELVAVITAALMAYMGADEVTDGLVIRSIRKVNRRKQTNELNIY